MKFTGNPELLYIWGDNIPGNTGKSKTDVMIFDNTITFEDAFTKYPGIWDKSTPELGDMRGNDFLVRTEEMQQGYAEDTYSDKPFLAPFLVDDSDQAVIICPGGAYLTKSVLNEGEEVARFLNEAGISAFVLWYRSYPYKAPLEYLDCQRAVRYVRYHAERFGIDPNKISTVGFSAGGNLAAVEALCFRNEAVDYPGYEPDEIDAVDGSVNAMALIYPAISLKDDKIVVVLGGADVYTDEVKRNAFSDKYELCSRVREGDSPAFLCACLDDDVVPPAFLMDFAKTLQGKGVSFELHMFPYGGHGFGACKPQIIPGIPMADLSACRQWMDLYVQWLNTVYK